ncbi:MAG: twin-arginine translocase TatA/TatE family subunit [Candidatus Omnitrophota bacterium]|nr:MAG: twin-arginine translocase TatA/TatE family subunit [Candidatus Omnitrophota bacterium]
MFRFGTAELLLIFLIVLLLFGASRLPEIARSVGKAIREFKKAGKELKEQAVTQEDDTE